MAGINQGWYARNEAVDYPVDETASCTDNNGERLPTDIIVDLTLRYPDIYGHYPFLASLSVTANMVSLTMEVADSLSGPNGFQPLAVIAVPRPVVVGRQYALQPQADGVAGFIVFGSGVNDTQRTLTMRFAGPQATRLTRRAARHYRAIPVTGVREISSGQFLSGIVRLAAVSPLEIVTEEREIDGTLRPVAVLRLTQNDRAGVSKTDLAKQLSGVVTADDNVFDLFSGPCGKRPESKTCGDPEPIEFINAVAPDCEGTLTLEFKGCAVVAQADGPCGLVIDCATGLYQVCTPPFIPNAEGELPSEVPPYTPPPIPPEPPGPGPDDGESIVVIGELPYTACFDDLTATEFAVQVGSFGFVVDDSVNESPYCLPEPVSISDEVIQPDSPAGAYCTLDGASRHVSIWDGFDDTTLGRKVISDVKMMPGPTGSLHNAAVILNYRAHQTVANRFVYYSCEVDFDRQEFRVVRFNGTAFNVVVAVTVPGLLLETWYRIETTVVPSGTQVAITARLIGDSDPINITLGPLLVSNYSPSTGRNGLGANRAVARFAFFRQEITGA